MRKLASLLAVLMLCIASVFAQNRTVTGVVVDSKGNPVPFASVTLRGASSGTSADAEGRFKLENVPQNATLVVTSTGFQPKEVVT